MRFDQFISAFCNQPTRLNRRQLELRGILHNALTPPCTQPAIADFRADHLAKNVVQMNGRLKRQSIDWRTFMVIFSRADQDCVSSGLFFLKQEK